MDIDLHAKALHLLEKIANSVHERDPKNPNLLCFSTTDVQVVEKWLEDFMQESQIEKSPSMDS
jgi:hypothetical protein